MKRRFFALLAVPAFALGFALASRRPNVLGLDDRHKGGGRKPRDLTAEVASGKPAPDLGLYSSWGLTTRGRPQVGRFSNFSGCYVARTGAALDSPTAATAEG